MVLRVYPYKMESESSKVLAKELGVLRVKPDGQFKSGDKYKILNWGATGAPRWYDRGEEWINSLNGVRVSCDKLLSLMKLMEHKVPCPEFTTKKEVALEWLAESDVVCRKLLRAHSGKGIIFVERGKKELDNAPMYTKYIMKKKEYRVHVFNGKVIDCQEKKKRREVAKPDYKVRSAANGWVFCRGGLEPTEAMKKHAIAAVEALGLMFGAVDIVWNEKSNRYYVLEVNTAPGLEGETVNSYVNAIKEIA